jgi:hypothetical protein
MWPASDLIKGHAELVARLERFDFGAAAKLVAGLGACPELHANSVRVDVLVLLVAASCKGKAQPDGTNLVEWVAKWMVKSPVAKHEDPVEDVFIGCVTCADGTYRVFGGNACDKDYWIERLLALIEGKKEFPPFAAAIEEALALLKLSDAIAERLELGRYSLGSGDAAGRMAVPHRSRMQELCEAVVFSSADLAQLGSSREKLARFILTDERRAQVTEGSLWNSALTRHPLRECGDGVLVLSPSGIVRALELQLLNSVLNTGLGDWMGNFFQISCAKRFVNTVAGALEVDAADFAPPPAPTGMPSMLPFYGMFDVGKPAIMLTYCPPLGGALYDPEGSDALSGDELAALFAHLDACAAMMEQWPGFSGGLVLINLVGLRQIMVPLPEWRKRWQIHVASLPDWLILTAHGECTAMRLWRLGLQRDRLEEAGTRLIDMAGLVNLYGYWTQNHFRLLRRDTSRSTTLINVVCDFGVRVRAERLQKEDQHAVRSHDGKKWIHLVRHNSRPLFAEDREKMLYVSPVAARQRELVGCAEEPGFRLWVLASAAGVSSEWKDLVYQLWDCAFNWAGSVAAMAVARWAERLPGSFELRLKIEAPGDALAAADFAALAPAELVLTSNATGAELTVPKGFLTYFQVPKNVAETKIVDALLAAVAHAVSEPLDDQGRARMTREIVRNDDARYFHMIEATGLEHLLAEGGRPDPLFVEEEDLADAHWRLAELMGSPKSDTIKGLAPCLELLKDAVAKLWEEIERLLATFEHQQVLAACFSAMGEVERDRAHWDLTSRSLLAMHSDTGNVHEVIRDRRSERSRVGLANRLLLEVAQYACPAQGGNVLTEADHRDLLARMLLLLEMAHHRDAISFGFMAPKVFIHPNGEIGVDEKFYVEVVSRYFTRQSLERTAQAVSRYERHFNRRAAAGDPAIPAAAVELDKVFVPEFGFSVMRLFDLLDCLRQVVAMSKQAGGVFDEPTFAKILEGCGFSAAERQSFLDRFTLPKRASWNADLPLRCKEADVFPWRFRRQLSLLTRPLVQLSNTPRTWYLSVPMLDQAIAYFVGHVDEGNLPETFFASQEMRRYVGDCAQKRGHDFAVKVEAVFVAAGLTTKLEVEMSAFGASRKDGLGDVDVLAWDAARGRVYVVECKCLRVAATIREVVQRLEDFKGDRKEKDSLGRHLRRVDWLKKNIPQLARYTGVQENKLKLVPLLVTNETVPMQFFKEMNDFLAAQVVPLADLSKKL